MDDITFAITSFDRLDLLDLTISSFKKYVNYPIKRWVMVEDSAKPEVYEQLLKKYPEFDIKFNEKRLGHAKSLFRLYDDIDTEWIFHSEDDWQYLKSGFMEKSLDVLKHDPNLIQVWLRSRLDTNRHPVETEIYKAGNTEYQLLAPEYLGVWCGYSTNPGLRRTSDQLSIDKSLKSETEISQEFLKQGRRAAILTTRYVITTGKGRSTFKIPY
jgi:hypothetical protein